MDISGLKGMIRDEVYEQLPLLEDKFGVNTTKRIAHFLGQCAHESGNFKFVNENLNYRAASLRGVFGKYFPADALAAQYDHKPVAIANRVYGNRMGNGNEASGDGYKYHGRGYIQLTGKNNYDGFSKFIGEDCIAHPDLVASKYPLASAAYFFTTNKLWAVSNKGSTDTIITNVTQMINGGKLGLDERKAYFKKFYKGLNVGVPA